MPKKSYLTPNQVAELLMVSPTAIRLWADKGDLKALSTPGGHRRFLPSDVDHFAKKRGLTLNNGQSRFLRILIVDDDAQLSRYLVTLLEGLEDKVVIETASDGFAAGLKVIDFKPHILLLDIMMPYMNGIQLCLRLKKEPSTKAIRVIAMTGFPSPDNIDGIINAGAEACLTKPIDEKILLEQLGIT